MPSVKEVFKNTSWMMISQTVLSVSGFIWTILIARYLGVNEFGIYSFAISFASIIGLIIDLGLTTYMIRDVSRKPELSSCYMGKIIPLRIVLSLISFIIGLIILLVMGKDRITILVSLFFIIESIVMVMGVLYQGEFQAFGKVKYQTGGTVINTVVLLTCIIATIYFDLGIIFVAISYIMGYSAMLIYLVIKGIQHISTPKLSIDFDFWKKSIKISLPFALTTVFTILYYSIDTVMLSLIVGDAATGVYNAAYKIITVLTTFFSVYQNVVFPLMSKMFTDSKEMLKKSFVKSIKYLSLIIIPISFGIMVYSNQIITLFFGEGYILSGDVMKILVWTVCWLFINGAATTLLNSSNKELLVTKIYSIAVVVNIILNATLIPFYSYNGAAFTTVISEIVICILMFYYIKKTPYTPNISILKDIFKIIVAGIVMFGVLQFVDNMWIGLFVGAGVYSAVVLALRTLDDDDKYLIKEIIH